MTDTISPVLITVRKCDPRAISHAEWAALYFEGETLGVIQRYTDFPFFRLLTNWDERWNDWRTSTGFGGRTLDDAVEEALDWIPLVSQRVTS